MQPKTRVQNTQSFIFFILKDAQMAGIIKFNNHVLSELNKTGIGAIPAKPSMATAIDSRTTILPKNKDGVRVTAMKTRAIQAKK
jgi:hypothetical protein